jgi:hypothetical protein
MRIRSGTKEKDPLENLVATIVIRLMTNNFVPSVA